MLNLAQEMKETPSFFAVGWENSGMLPALCVYGVLFAVSQKP